MTSITARSGTPKTIAFMRRLSGARLLARHILTKMPISPGAKTSRVPIWRGRPVIDRNELLTTSASPSSYVGELAQQTGVRIIDHTSACRAQLQHSRRHVERAVLRARGSRPIRWGLFREVRA